jgi:hypothetical protein
MKSVILCPAALLLALAACRPPAVRELAAPTVLEAPFPARPGFGLVGSPATPYLSWVDRDTRALVLAAVDGSTPPAYLERISDLPEQDPLSGAHLLFAEGQDLHLLYLDQEESLLLKHVRRGLVSGNSWIEVLPGRGRPVAAFAAAEGLDCFLEAHQKLWRLGPRAALVRAPFRLEGVSSRFVSEGLRGFTAYDAESRRLLLFLLRETEVETREVALYGQVQDSAVDPEGRLQILAWDPRSSRILLHRTADPSSGFQVQPVTPSRATGALALVQLPAGLGFLFAELSARQSGHHLSLLHFEARSGYVKTVLCRFPGPISGLRASVQPDALYVAVLADSLKVLRVDYGRLR